MKLKFSKMHGLGNDFMVIDGINQSFDLTPEQIRTLSQRQTGVGFDQCLVIQPSTRPEIDFSYRIFNADGTEVGQCGNGARCLARFAWHYGLTQKKQFYLGTLTTTMKVEQHDDENTVTIHMDCPRLNPQDVPFLAPKQASNYLITTSEGECEIHAINVGNPHAVLVVPDIETAQVTTLGRQISQHPDFPEQVNVGFMQVKASDKIKLRVYERGCGETKACGSGAVAAAAIGHLYHNLSSRITVSLPGGDLQVYWPEIKGPIMLTGPAALVYEGFMINKIS